MIANARPDRDERASAAPREHRSITAASSTVALSIRDQRTALADRGDHPERQ
jgi:hypothetical protein